jgi:hypothetical protein
MAESRLHQAKISGGGQGVSGVGVAELMMGHDIRKSSLARGGGQGLLDAKDRVVCLLLRNTHPDCFRSGDINSLDSPGTGMSMGRAT